MENPEMTALQFNSHSIRRKLMSSSSLMMGQVQKKAESPLKTKAI